MSTKRNYMIEIEFDEDIALAEQDRKICMVLEALVSDWWTCATTRLRLNDRDQVPNADFAIAIPHPPPNRGKQEKGDET